MLQLSLDSLQQISTHAERTYPEECCGLLLGRVEADGRKRLSEVWETPNAWSAETAEAVAFRVPPGAASTRDRYWIDPQDLLKAQRYARDHQLNVIGIYHSHPDQAAVPSECDRLLAWARYAYVIVSVRQGKVQDLRCWSLDETHQFQPEEISVV